MIRFISFILTVLVLAGAGFGQEDARRAQVAAATANAVAQLHDDIARTPISGNLSVKDLLDRTDSAAALDLTLQRAQLIGGPRWIGNGVCQVHLEISGPRVAQALTQIAATHAGSTPVDAAVLQRQLADWSNRSFCASGTSMGAAYAEQLRPRTDHWTGVGDAVRQQAVNDAIDDAADRLLQSIQPIALAGGKTIGDALQRKAVEQRVRGWILSRPVTNVTFHEDLSVAVDLSVPPKGMAQAIQSAVTAEKDFPQPTPEQWQRIQAQIAGRLSPAVGVGHVLAGQTAHQMTTTRALSLIPDQPPAWVDRQIEAEGLVKAEGSRLKGARLAEHQAIGRMADEINTLPLTADVSIGQAARTDPDVERAVHQALRHAHTDRAEYLEDGSVSVRMSLNLRDLWQELDALRP